MSLTREKPLPKILRIVLSLPFLAVGVFAWAWSLFCFAGGPGPDARRGNMEPVLYGSGFMLFSILCGGVFLLLNRKKRRALITLGILYDGVTALFALLLTAAFFAMYLEHCDWIFYLLFAGLLLWGISLAGGYGLFRLVKKTAEPESEQKEGGK